MNVGSIIYPVVLLIFTAASLVALLRIRLLYTDPKQLPIKPPAWWPYSEKAWRKWARAIPVLASFGLPLAVAGAIAEYGDLSSPVVRILFLLCSLLIFFGLILGLIVAFFGRPKWLIPPHLR